MILVTGASGFVGRHLCAALRAAGHVVRGLVHRPEAAARLARQGIEPWLGEITDEAALRAAVSGVAAVVHTVAIIHERGRHTFTAVNYEGTARLLNATEQARVARFVHLSALGADAASPYPYLRSKGLGEQAVMAADLGWTILRPSIIFGPGDAFFGTLATIARLSPVIPIVGDGQTRFQPIAVADVVACVQAALQDDRHRRQRYDIAGPDVLTYEQLVDLVRSRLGLRRIILHIPPAIVRPVAAAMERLLPRPLVTPGQLDLLAVDNVTADNAAPRLLGRPPQSVRDGLAYLRP
jgi:NADH dehydrogenase